MIVKPQAGLGARATYRIESAADLAALAPPTPIAPLQVEEFVGAREHTCETVTIRGLAGEFKPRQRMTAEIRSSDGSVQEVPLVCRIDTPQEVIYFEHGGILPFALRQLVRS